MLTLDPIKLAACKTPDEKLFLCMETLKDELSKERDARDNQGIAETKKMVDEAMVDIEKRISQRFPQFAAPSMDAKDVKRFSSLRAAAGLAHNNWSLAPFEKEWFAGKDHQDFIQKVASAGVDTAGGFAVPNEKSDELIPKLQPETIAMKLGVRSMGIGAIGSLTFNRVTGETTAEWVGEMLTAAKSDLALGQYSVTPKALSAKGDLSNLLLLLGEPSAEEMWLENARLKFQQGIDRAVLVGPATVSTKAPIGIAGTPGILTSTTASLDFDKIVDFEDKLKGANAYSGKLGWAMTPAQYTVIRKLKDTSLQPIVLRSLTEKGLTELLGLPIYTTTAMGTTGANTLALGQWNQARIFNFFNGAVFMKRSDTSDTALDSDLTRVTLRTYADVGVDQPTAFVYASA